MDTWSCRTEAQRTLSYLVSSYCPVHLPAAPLCISTVFHISIHVRTLKWRCWGLKWDLLKAKHVFSHWGIVPSCENIRTTVGHTHVNVGHIPQEEATAVWEWSCSSFDRACVWHVNGHCCLQLTDVKEQSWKRGMPKTLESLCQSRKPILVYMEQHPDNIRQLLIQSDANCWWVPLPQTKTSNTRS